MKKNKDLIGIKSKEGNDYLISQFADDTSLALMNKGKCLNKAFSTLKRFGCISGLKINVEKNKNSAAGIRNHLGYSKGI